MESRVRCLEGSLQRPLHNGDDSRGSTHAAGRCGCASGLAKMIVPCFPRTASPSLQCELRALEERISRLEGLIAVDACVAPSTPTRILASVHDKACHDAPGSPCVKDTPTGCSHANSLQNSPSPSAPEPFSTLVPQLVPVQDSGATHDPVDVAGLDVRAPVPFPAAPPLFCVPERAEAPADSAEMSRDTTATTEAEFDWQLPAFKSRRLLQRGYSEPPAPVPKDAPPIHESFGGDGVVAAGTTAVSTTPHSEGAVGQSTAIQEPVGTLTPGASTVAKDESASVQSKRQLRRGHSEPAEPSKPDSCCICFSMPRECAFTPCGHRCVCRMCGIAAVRSDRRCPICRAVAGRVLRILDP